MVEIDFKPRDAFWPYFERRERWACLVVHRRGGKTYACLQDVVAKALTHPRQDPPARYAYIAPTRDQAKDIAWPYLTDFTRRLPGIVVNQADLRITLPNGAAIRLYSGESYERMRGLYFDGVILDEAQDLPSNAWPTVILPTLTDYRGWATFIGTPKGRNSFWKRHLHAETSEDWYSLLLKASESGILDPKAMREMRRDPMMTDERWNQELECEFGLGAPGAIYANELHALEQAGHICDFEADGGHLVYTTWDIGSPRNTAVIYWQRVGREWRIIDHDRDLELKTGERVAHMIGKGYNFGAHLLPHDAGSQSPTGMTFQKELMAAGLPNVRIIPRTHDVEAGIARMHDLMPNLWINKTKCENLIDALTNYQRKESQEREGYVETKIVHDWTSHDADAFRYLGEAEQAGLIEIGDHRKNGRVRTSRARTGFRRDRRRR